MEALARIYFFGQGVDVDLDKAFRYYSQLAHLGDAGAQYMVGHMYLHGLSVAKDLEAARLWFTDAAAKGHVKARSKVAWFYLHDGEVKQCLALLIRTYYEMIVARIHHRRKSAE